jgi:hypothetical protein
MRIKKIMHLHGIWAEKATDGEGEVLEVRA